MIFAIQAWRRFASKRQEGAGASALFLIGSVVSHGLLYGIAASVSSGGSVALENEPAWIEIDVTEPQPEAVQAAKSQEAVSQEVIAEGTKRKGSMPSKARAPKRKVAKRAAPTTLTRRTTSQDEANHVAPSIDDAGVEETVADSFVVVDPNANANESEEVAQVAPIGLGDGDEQKVDPRVVIRAWMKKVQRSVQMRALRDYPRAAQRMRMQGNVFVAMNIDADGRVTNVRAARASGHSALDDAAVEAVLAIGELPTPPREFLRMGKPLTVPIAYRIR